MGCEDDHLFYGMETTMKLDGADDVAGGKRKRETYTLPIDFHPLTLSAASKRLMLMTPS